MRLSSLFRRNNFRKLSWGFADQAFSSITNFGLTIMIGRRLGPIGLGTVFLGFAAYLLLLTAQRLLLTEPIGAISAASDPEAQAAQTRFGLTMSLMLGFSATGCLLLAGLLISGSLGNAFLLFAPWIVPTLVQDYWRAILFRDGRGRAATLNDAIWFLAMAAFVPLAWHIGTSTALVACWGIGAVVGAGLGFGQTRHGPGQVAAAIKWWRADAMDLGGWLAAGGAVMILSGYVLTLVLLLLLGTAAIGGLRAAQATFAPLTFIVPALSLPGIPALSRALVESTAAARRLAGIMSAIATGATVLYLLIIVIGQERLLTFLFGPGFSGYSSLLAPIGIRESVIAAATGYAFLLRAERRGRVSFVARVIGAVVSLIAAPLLARDFGVVGAAWGMTAAACFASAFVIYDARRIDERAVSLSDDEAVEAVSLFPVDVDEDVNRWLGD